MGKKRKQTESEADLKKSIGYVVTQIEYSLWFELGLGAYWVIMLLVVSGWAINELLPLIVSSLHVASPLSAILCLEFFIYENKHMSRFTNLVWQVPTFVTLISDVFLLFLAYNKAWLPAYHGHIEEGGASFGVAWALVILLALLSISSLVMSVYFILLHSKRSKLSDNNKTHKVSDVESMRW